ncbi:hypothetical protein, partial [Ciceribacter ferrooxidans]
MLNLWLVVLLGFVASALGQQTSCTSHDAIKDQINQACEKNHNNLMPKYLIIPDLLGSVGGLPGGVLPSLTKITIINVKLDSLILSDDLSSISVSLTVSLSCKEVTEIQLKVILTFKLNYDISPSGSLAIRSGDLSITITLKSSSVTILNTLLDLLLGACRPLLKLHFSACFDGILGIVNGNLESGGGYRNGLVTAVASGVSVVGGVLKVVHNLVDNKGNVISLVSPGLVYALTEGQVWGTAINLELIGNLWGVAQKSHTTPWSASLLQNLFLGLSLGSSISVTVTLDAAGSCAIKPDGVSVSTGASVVVSSQSGERLLEIHANVIVMVTLTGHGGGVGLNLLSISIDG